MARHRGVGEGEVLVKDQMRWFDGEQRANTMLENGQFAEMVALGYMVRPHSAMPWDSQLKWLELNNVDEKPEEAFTVDGAELHSKLESLKAKHGPGNVLVHVIWHSHIKTREPSEHDVKFFPEWLCAVGVVYHVPSKNSCLYDQDGVIDSS